MANLSSNDLRSGVKILIDNDPYNVLENEMVKPGKGQAFNRIRIRNLKTGRVVEKTFKANDTFEPADVLDVEMQYLYTDGEFWHFMVQETFDQYACDANAVGDEAMCLKGEAICIVTLLNSLPLSIWPRSTVILKVIETGPGFKGDTAAGGGKPATLETGAVVKVPFFVNVDELIKVNTRTGEYLARAKE